MLLYSSEGEGSGAVGNFRGRVKNGPWPGTKFPWDMGVVSTPVFFLGSSSSLCEEMIGKGLMTSVFLLKESPQPDMGTSVKVLPVLGERVGQERSGRWF